MVKVTVTTISGMKTDLFPEGRTLRQALESLVPDYGNNINTLNGKSLDEANLDRRLGEAADKSIVCLASIPRGPGIGTEIKDGQDDDCPF